MTKILASMMFMFALGCGLPQQDPNACVLDAHPMAVSGDAQRDGCTVTFSGTDGKASSWADINGGELHVEFTDTCPDAVRTVTLTDDKRLVRVTRSASTAGTIALPYHDGMVWMDLSVQSARRCSTVASFTVSR